MEPEKLVSGGQTGADRAALDVAKALGLEYGGWVPAGRAAEDGPISEDLDRLREAPDPRPATRTEWNVRDSDATLILSHGPLTGGSAYTVEMARKWARPHLHLELDRLDTPSAVARAREWLREVRPGVLNVAGPRASEDPEIYGAVRRVLEALFQG